MKRFFATVSVVLIALSVYGRMPEEDINLELSAELLSEGNAVIYPGAEIQTKPLNDGDTEIVVGWPDSVGKDWPMLRAALELYTWPTHMLDGTKSRLVDDPVIDGTEYPGRWRQATISRLRRPKQGSDQFDYWIVLTLRSGYSSSVNWDEARLVEGGSSESYAQSVTGVTDTIGFDASEHAVVRFPNINPFKIQSVMAQFSKNTYTNPVVYGETLSGEWWNVFVSGGKDDDGAGFVDLILSRQRFTMKLYQLYSTPRQASVYRLFDVPKSLAQTIIDDWQAEGRSADASYNDGSHLCTITLSDRDAVKDNLSTAWIWTGCDQKFKEHFAWGYTKTEVTNWLDVTGFEATPTVPPVTRTLRMNMRGDGLLDVIMSERTFETLDATAPQFTITLPIGTNITRQIDYGYNYNSTEMAAAALQNVYNTTVAAVGKTVDFKTTREDDCSFDWIATITMQINDILGDIDTYNTTNAVATTNGVWRKSYSMRGATDAEITDLESSLVSAARKNVTLDLTMRDDGLADVKAGIVVVQENITNFSSGTGGVQSAVYIGANADSMPSVASAARVRVLPQVTALDDGTYNYSIQSNTVQENTNYFNSGNNGVQIEIYSGANADAVPTGLVSAVRVRVSPQVTPLDDSTYNYGIQRITVKEATDSASTGTGGISRAVYAGKNVDVGDLTALLTNSAMLSSRLVDVSPSMSAQDDGSIIYSVNRETKQASSNTWDVGAKGRTVAVSIERNAGALANPDIDSSTAVGRSVELTPVYDDAGNLHYRKDDIQQVTLSDSVTGGSYTRSITYEAGTGDTTGPADATPVQGTSYAFNLQQNKDGTTEWAKQTIGAQSRSTNMTLSRLKPARRNSGFAETGTVFRGATTLPKDFSATDEYGYYKSLRMNDDATYDGTVVEVTYDGKVFYDAYPPATISNTVNALAWDHMSRRGRQQYTNNSNGSTIYWYTTQIRKMYITIPYVVIYTWRDDYEDAIDDIDEGMQQSKVTLVDIGGTMKWKAEKWILEGDTNATWTAFGQWLNSDVPAGFSPYSP